MQAELWAAAAQIGIFSFCAGFRDRINHSRSITCLEKTLCSSRFSSIPLWEQRAGGPCPAWVAAGWPNLKGRMVSKLLRGAAGVFRVDKSRFSHAHSKIDLL